MQYGSIDYPHHVVHTRFSCVAQMFPVRGHWPRMTGPPDAFQLRVPPFGRSGSPLMACPGAYPLGSLDLGVQLASCPGPLC